MKNLIKKTFKIKSYAEEFSELMENQRISNEFSYYNNRKMKEVVETKPGDYPIYSDNRDREKTITAVFDLTQDDIDFFLSDYDGHICYLQGVNYYKPKEFIPIPGIQKLTLSEKK